MTKSWTSSSLPELGGRIVVVTGANSGLGYETALALAQKGATVVMACRDLEKGRAAAEAIRSRDPRARLAPMLLDLASLASIATFAEELASQHGHLDVLCNNAGVMALPYRQTVDGFEAQFGTNHLGHFALTGRLLPLLLRAPAARIVTVSSIYHRFGKVRFEDLRWERGYRKWPAYSMSKLCNLLFAFELDRRLRAADQRAISVAAHPGYAATNLQQAGPRMAGAAFMSRLMGLTNGLFAQSAARGAWPQLYACAGPDVQGGDYFGPGGPFEVWGSPRRVSAKDTAKNPADAGQLWSMSEEMTGVRYAFGAGSSEAAG